MAVEFDIKMRRPLSLSALVERVQQTLECWYQGLAPKLTARGDEALDRTGADAWIEIGDQACVFIGIHSAGDERTLGYDGGLWAYVSAGELRVPASLFLAVIVAAHAAEQSAGDLVDDVRLLDFVHGNDSREVLASLRIVSGDARTFQDAACAVFDRSFGAGTP